MDDIRGRLEECIKRVGVDRIQEALEHVLEKRPKDVVKSFLERAGFGEFDHPLVGNKKIIDLGNFVKEARKSESYRRLNDKLVEILERGLKDGDIDEISGHLKDLRNQLIDHIINNRIRGAGKGLRHIHAPGSVARSKGMNFYFPGEEYTDDILCHLASRFCHSIALGGSLGIYSENRDLMMRLAQLAAYMHWSRVRIEPKNLKIGRYGISRYEAERPHAALLAFILWLVERRLTAKEDHEVEALIHSILDGLKTSPICLFFMPPEEERWSTIYIPRLDTFIDRWILNEAARRGIKDLRNSLLEFIARACNAARRRGAREVENSIDLLMDNYEALCRGLIEHGSPDPYAVRRMMDIMVDLATKYGLSIYLRPLSSVAGHERPM